MLVRTLAEATGNERDVKAPNGNWRSRRLLLADDQMGYSFHITNIYAGTETYIHYKHHLESVYCIRGHGEVQTIEEGKTYPIEPGTLYNLDKHDAHKLRAFEELELACVFNPPITGREVHGEDGAYPPSE